VLRPLLHLMLPHQRVGWGCTRSWERAADLSWPKGYPTAHEVVLSNKSWGEEEKGVLWKLHMPAIITGLDSRFPH